MPPPRNDSPQMDQSSTTLFQGARFWLSLSVPQRLRFKDLIKQHGGIVVLMEKDADVKLVDHTRKDLPSDTFSYKYVERSIKNGKLEDLEAHRVGPSAPRPMGASNIARKSTRSSFTLKEDQMLYDWVAHFAQDPEAPVQGTIIYQRLSELMPSHPWQSWRNRYVKQLRDKGRPGGGTSLSYEEIIQCAPPQAERPKTLPTRTPSKDSSARSSSSRVPQAGLPAAAQPSTANNPEQARVSIPETPNQRWPDSSPLKRKVVDTPPSGGPSSRRLRHESPEYQPESPRLTAKPTSAIRPESAAAPVVPAKQPPLTGLGIPNLLSISNPPTQNPHRVTRETSPCPENVTEKAAPVPPAPPRPLGDNAFAQSGRFKKHNPRPRQPVKDVFQDPVDPNFLELPFFPSSPSSNASGDDASDQPDIDPWINEKLAQGAKDHHVFEALHCTGMATEIADRVLEYLAAGKGVPNNMPGVWTAEDDSCLQAMEHSRVQRVLTKHGAQAYQERWEYLSMARKAGAIE